MASTSTVTVHTNSSLTCYRRCPREYEYSYLQLRRPRGRSTALSFGSLIHASLNAYWGSKGRRPDERYDAAMCALRLAAPLSGLDNWDICRAEEMILGYCARWGEQDRERVTMGVEKRFQCGSITGSLDALIREPDGSVRLIEHKTSSKDISPGSPYWANVIAADSQVSTYMAALRGMGYEATDCIYDALHKITLLPHKATPVVARKYTKATRTQPSRLYADQRETDETIEEYRLRIREDIASKPQHYYVRQVVVRLDSDEDKHGYDIRGTTAMIEFSDRTGLYPRHPASCQRYNAMCPYHGVCSGIDNINNERSFRTAKTAHEELE